MDVEIYRQAKSVAVSSVGKKLYRRTTLLPTDDPMAENTPTDSVLPFIPTDRAMLYMYFTVRYSNRNFKPNKKNKIKYSRIITY
jgi:hypothetical protein